MNSRLLRRIARWLALIVAASTSASASLDSASVRIKELSQGYREHRILAKPKASFRDTAELSERRHGIRLRKRFPRLGDLRVLELASNDSADAAVARLRASGRYEYVERDHLRYASVIPNDASFSEQWSLRNTGQNSGTAGADIAATAGWNIRTDASNVVVAIVDSGIRLSHEDLAANLWSSPAGTHGINAALSQTASGYTDPTDDLGHGTHVAGIIGAVGHNATGISGVAWNVQLMALKFLSPNNGSVSDSIECINYAIDHGADIINASYGSNTRSEFELSALRAARNAGIIVVVAAGNEASDNDTVPSYPANYPLDNIVVVANTTRTDALSDSSNYGPGTVDLAAPGYEIHSTYFSSDSSYRTQSGTSMSAPHVSGALALLKAEYPNDTYRQLINRLLRSTSKLPALDGKIQTGGRLNLSRALASTDNRPFNDAFADRAVLRGSNIRIRSNNTGATLDSAEPAHAGTDGGASLWWSWTAPATTSVGFDTAGSSYDTVLGIYTGSSLGSLSPVAANDDANSETATSRLSLNVTAGTTYHIAIDGKNGASGYTALKIGAVPVNDAFAAAKTVTGISIRETATTLNASREAGEPDPTGKAAGHSVWYRWTAPSSGSFSLAAFATSSNTVAAIYTGNSVSNLTTVASNDNNANGTNTDALVSFTATSGTTYHLQVDHSSSSSSADGGDFILTLTDSLWEFPTHDIVTSSPAVAADGTVFVGSADGYIYAINPDGTQKWRLDASLTEGFDGGSPTLADDGTLYIGSVDGSLFAIDSLTGAKKWSFSGGSAIYATPITSFHGTLYFRDETKLYALNPAGALLWSFTLNTAAAAGTYSCPVIDRDGTIYIGTTDGFLYALIDQGDHVDVKWTYETDDNGDIYTTPAIAADGTLYFGTLAGNFYAITPGTTSATTKWSRPLPEFNRDDNSITASPAIAPDGTIYFAAYDHKLYALNPATGVIKWTYTLGDEVRASSPAIAADGTIFIGVYDGSVHAINPDGTLQRTFPAALLIRSSPVLAHDRLYFGSNDAKLHAFAIGQSLAASPWPMFLRNPAHQGRASSALNIVTQPASQAASARDSVTLTTAATGTSTLTYQWQHNGTTLPAATSATLTLPDLQPADTGLYTAVATNASSTATSRAAIVALTTSEKVLGTAIEYGEPNIVHPNGNTFDQILLTGGAASITADHSPDPALNQITRLSYIDLDDDIVQVEFSGPGTLTLVLDNPSDSAPPRHYNQNIAYMKGHAGIVIAGATAQTNVSVFTVGRATAYDPNDGGYNILFPPSDTNNPANNTNPIFDGHISTDYDGIADLAFIAISSADGRFGGVRTANATYFAANGLTGLYAPDIVFEGPIFIGDINAFDSATPAIIVGAVTDARIAGGSLEQPNARPVEVHGLTQLKFTAGADSHGNPLLAQQNKAALREGPIDVTTQIVLNPAP